MKNNIRPLKLYMYFKNINDHIFGCACGLVEDSNICDLVQDNISIPLNNGNYVQADSLIQETKEQLRIWNEEK